VLLLKASTAAPGRVIKVHRACRYQRRTMVLAVVIHEMSR